VHGSCARLNGEYAEIDDELDQIKIQNSVREVASEGIAQDAQLIGRPSLLQMLQEMTAQLVAGDALDLESLIDVITLDSRHVTGPSIALDRLRHDTVSSGPSG
jgi:hypothetical protein